MTFSAPTRGGVHRSSELKSETLSLRLALHPFAHRVWAVALVGPAIAESGGFELLEVMFGPVDLADIRGVQDSHSQPSGGDAKTQRQRAETVDA